MLCCCSEVAPLPTGMPIGNSVIYSNLHHLTRGNNTNLFLYFCCVFFNFPRINCFFPWWFFNFCWDLRMQLRENPHPIFRQGKVFLIFPPIFSTFPADNFLGSAYSKIVKARQLFQHPQPRKQQKLHFLQFPPFFCHVFCFFFVLLCLFEGLCCNPLPHTPCPTPPQDMVWHRAITRQLADQGVALPPHHTDLLTGLIRLRPVLPGWPSGGVSDFQPRHSQQGSGRRYPVSRAGSRPGFFLSRKTPQGVPGRRPRCGLRCEAPKKCWKWTWPSSCTGLGGWWDSPPPKSRLVPTTLSADPPPL